MNPVRFRSPKFYVPALVLLLLVIGLPIYSWRAGWLWRSKAYHRRMIFEHGYGFRFGPIGKGGYPGWEEGYLLLVPDLFNELLRQREFWQPDDLAPLEGRLVCQNSHTGPVGGLNRVGERVAVFQ